MIRYILLFLILIIYLPIFAQKKWSLEECIQYAKDNNIQLKQQQLDIKDAKLGKKQAKLNYLPSIGAGTDYNMTFGRILDPTTYEFIENKTGADMNLSASASVSIFAGMKNLHTLQRAEINMQITTATIEKLKNDLTLNITKAYLDLLLTEDNIQISQQRLITLNEQKIRTLKLIEAEKNTRGDLLQIESQIYETQSQLLQLNSKKNLAKLNISQLLEIENYEEFNISKPSSDYIVPKVYCRKYVEVINKAQNMPEIQKANLEIKGAKTDISIAKSMLYPILNLNGSYGSRYSNSRQKLKLDNIGNPAQNGNEFQYEKYPFSTQLKDNRSGYITLNLVIPIFTAWKYRNQVNTYKISKQKTEYNLKLKQKQLSTEIKQSIINVNTALEQYHILAKNTEIIKEAFIYTEIKLNSGTASYFDYITALNNLTMANLQLSLAKYEYLFCDKIIDFYIGNPIRL